MSRKYKGNKKKCIWGGSIKYKNSLIQLLLDFISTIKNFNVLFLRLIV